MIDDLAEGLANRLKQGASANVALMHLLMVAASPDDAVAALHRCGVLHPTLATSLAALHRLVAAQPEAWARVHAVSDSVDHAPAPASSDEALAHWRNSFDRLAASSPEAGVALYALGDPALLEAATTEVVAALAAWGLLGRERDGLDLGCGIGRFAACLAPHLRSVHGIDLSSGMVEEARRRVRLPNVSFATTDGRDLAEMATGSVDIVLAADVFPYLVEAGLADRHVAEMARVLRPGGSAVILNHSYRGDPARDRAEIAAAAAAYGFDVLRSGEQPFRLWDGKAFVLVRPLTP